MLLDCPEIPVFLLNLGALEILESLDRFVVLDFLGTHDHFEPPANLDFLANLEPLAFLQFPELLDFPENP